ncbi:MAG: transcription elongation factor GreAB [Actinobacteria bacterium]|nr:transcription elongation factor GreAB [Actinomycetota bacterium]
MSRAFVKEPESGAPDEPLPPRRISEHPNYVTPSGLQLLQDDLGRLTAERAALLSAGDDAVALEQLRHVERDIAYVEARLGSAILVDPATQPPDQVAFAAIVTVREQGGHEHTYQIVGEDEADAQAGQVSDVSPLAQALLGSRVGDTVTWKRPLGDLVLTVVSIAYR